MNREKQIIKTSIIGILANVLLAGFKAVVGLLSHSIAVVLDAVNNLSDALSSVITIVGTKLAGKKPDKKHPLGYGRIEFLSAMVISLIVLYAGITSLVESIKKIITPEEPDYSTAAIVIISVAVVVKLILGRYVKGVGKKVNSDSLIASGTDAMLDSVISAATLVAATVFLLSGISLEAYLGGIISLVIIKSGFEMLGDALNRILGERVDSELSKEIKKTMSEHPDVHGAYDLVLHSYGPDTWVGSAHVEIDDTMTADRIDKMTRELQQLVFERHQIILTGISIYSVNTKGDQAELMREKIRSIVMANDYVLQMHGFYLDEDTSTVQFDMVMDFAAPDKEEECKKITEELKKQFPGHHFQITLDTDVSD